MSRPRLLFVAVEFPYPPRSGFTLKEWHLASKLGRHADVTLVTLLNPDEEPSAEARAHVAQHVSRVVTLRQGPRRTGAAMARLQPPFVSRFATPEILGAIRTLTTRERFDVVHLDCLGSTALLPAIAQRPGTLVISPNDAYGLMVERRDPGAGLARRAAAGLNAALVRRYERRVYGAADQVHFVSEVDCDYARRHYPDAPVHWVPLGIEVPEAPAADVDPHAMVFVANMLEGHGASIAAFVRDTLPMIRAQVPEARLWVVGAHPPDSVRLAAEADERITVTGWVDDVRPWIERAAIALSLNPLPGGMQTKALAPMAAGKAVVGLPQNFVAIQGAVDGTHFVSAGEPAEFAAQVASLLRDRSRREAIGTAARRLIQDRYTWDRVLDRYVSLVPGLSG